MSRKEINQKLRGMKQPVTLFGESDVDRYNRLVQLEEKVGDAIMKGEQETFRTFLP